MNTTQSTTITTAALPGCTPRLLTEQAGQAREDLAAYRRLGGYRPLADTGALLSEVESSGLVGRGGAAFPLAVKLRTVRDNGRLIADTGGPVVIANGEEGEPASIKDRWLLRNRPHLVLDGLRLAAAIVAADRAYVYVSDPESAHSVETALGELDSETQGLAVQVLTVQPGYVAGEETAAVRVINGGPAKPTDKPPRPFEAGVNDRPTLVSNVETLANLPYLQGNGSAAFRSQGTALSTGTFLATITGGGKPPVLYELPHGLAFTELLALHGISPEQVRGALMGGYFAGLLNRTVLESTLDHETMRRLGSGLGCGAVSVITDDCPVAVAASVLAYFDRENAGQCGSCFNGTAAMAAAAGALRDGAATKEDVDRLRRWSVLLRGRGACATLDAATNVAASMLDQFPAEVTAHLDGNCPDCGGGAFRADRPYEVEGVRHA
ncbi:NADH-ubiquinone oxidoreductase-F iron-sulfur binding region domain-containing protein [Mycobacterium montefiorense]|uniref:NADH dehydrogenase n=1 Tax=Mycobacterium montefiorense TaxID=154654 RepID=A0AA37PLA1_9MYCO|nr:NADH-ubiquinone oxidoreductase-F iron-sulfur binding region domain-containing protein [Mycobacterium montefiorense]GBG40236.1 NADH dehydrogenase [Mycobacterium montefiorense]GKU35239.1 NADH dehydrogenase [Mycobacterium montefiorense]GKU40193.1 NADH dehydrogenase [Mycobacterium montefiorense]GKU46132.1 NADH dehydrogenase [Mycobacterium montefiorense]GKU53004.1 NADH dehydrogenase [Mycobacterium montefiorense]